MHKCCLQILCDISEEIDDINLIYFVKDKVLVGGILLTHLQNLPCNAHEIAEIEIPAGSVKDSAQTEIGNKEIDIFWHVSFQG